MKAFMGCLLHFGALRQNNLSVEMLFRPVDGNSEVRATFEMHRFSNFLNHLRLDDKATRTERRARDLFAPIRDVWNSFHDNQAKYYVPSQNITVDGQLVPFRGRCSFIQYIPSKPDIYDIKMFWACDASNNYPLRALSYLGRDTTSAKSSQRSQSVAAEVVSLLTDDFHESGHNITSDSYFTDLKLAESLVKKKIDNSRNSQKKQNLSSKGISREEGPPTWGIKISI